MRLYIQSGYAPAYPIDQNRSSCWSVHVLRSLQLLKLDSNDQGAGSGRYRPIAARTGAVHVRREEVLVPLVVHPIRRKHLRDKQPSIPCSQRDLMALALQIRPNIAPATHATLLHQPVRTARPPPRICTNGDARWMVHTQGSPRLHRAANAGGRAQPVALLTRATSTGGSRPARARQPECEEKENEKKKEGRRSREVGGRRKGDLERGSEILALSLKQSGDTDRG